MPNHCHNDLYIDGPKEQVAALLALIGADAEVPAFDFNKVIPMPSQFEGHDGFNAGGYEWCIANWGTKWGAYNVARRDYGGACVTFQTAWGPSKQVVLALHKLFPLCNLHLEFFERGMEFTGGMSALSEDEWYEDSPWQAGVASSEWNGKYRGHRGG